MRAFRGRSFQVSQREVDAPEVLPRHICLAALVQFDDDAGVFLGDVHTVIQSEILLASQSRAGARQR